LSAVRIKKRLLIIYKPLKVATALAKQIVKLK